MILTTGGGGKIFPFTTNGTIKTADGMALAYRAGVPLKDMEFVQYHPTGLPGTGILITEATRGEGGYLRNNEGERFLVDYDYGVGKKAELGPRDMISRAIVQEIEAGRGFSGSPTAQYVAPRPHPSRRGRHQLASCPSCASWRRPTSASIPVTTPIPIRPVVHYMMGGVDTDINGATTLPGLYAAGEVACVSINGANRLGSNSLTECLVFGAAAAGMPWTYAKGASARATSGRSRAQVEEEAGRVANLRGRKKGGEKIAAIRRELNNTMESSCGVYREQDSMQAGVSATAQLRGRVADLRLEDESKVFNTELITALELLNMVEVAEVLAVSAAHRKESRGAHTCKDFTTRDDQNYLYHTMAHHDPAGPRLGKKDVVLGNWVPEERKY